MSKEEKDEIKQTLSKYEPNEQEREVIRSAVFNVINLATVGAGSLGLAGHLWNKSRPKRTGIPTILGFFTGLALGAALGMEKGMQTLRTRLPLDSKLRSIILETDQLRHARQHQVLRNENISSVDLSQSQSEGDVLLSDNK
ncbi:hypothetical protein BX666DRAFT_2028147 [Dichotomocladium elegans]|nr:hypothetical protein BX666DRAFT_2028147 [Dichotomocladium elegans]